ncbi:MAG: glycoside hydrolase family 15 protein, partial [Terracidiphilus sp.]
DWTVTNDGVLHPEIKRHYMRIRPPESGEAYACESSGTEKIHLENQPPGARDTFEAREIIDAGFLELVRYGVRRAGDPLMVDSLKVVDAVLKRDLPQGPGWLRYNYDGYGNRPDGGPFQGWGQGRVWPLLTGERAHYELAAGNGFEQLIRTYENFATSGQLLPEQVWDQEDLPEANMRRGKPDGSALPLVWAHAEYLKLLRSALDGKIYDRIDAVYNRYCEPEGRGRVRRKLEIYSRHRPIQKIAPGETLRILDDAEFEAVWSDDAWQTTHTAASRGRGYAGFSADLTPGAGTGALEWTMHWPGEDRWLGYNVKVKIEG